MTRSLGIDEKNKQKGDNGKRGYALKKNKSRWGWNEACGQNIQWRRAKRKWQSVGWGEDYELNY